MSKKLKELEKHSREIDVTQNSFIDLKYKVLDDMDALLTKEIKGVEKLEEELKGFEKTNKGKVILAQKRIKMSIQIREEIKRDLISLNTRLELVKAELDFI